ncbi:AAA family ATPase [Pedobacter psychrotolerans]|uniref:AAA family ATPase n=1 Tax=Pedobacter psychrotolerans TaxID=1843235 RepID=UPI003F95787E
MDFEFKLSDYDYNKIIDLNTSFTIDTSAFRTINQLCKESQRFTRMIGIVGETGFGKSTSLEYYANQNDNVYYLNVETSMSAKVFLQALLEVLGFKNIHNEKNSYNLTRSIVYFLKNTPGKHLIILDECGKLSNNVLLHMHDIRNAISNVAGVIFSGPHYFHKKLIDETKYDVKGMPEFSSRISNWIFLDNPSYHEKIAYCSARGVINQDVLKHICRHREYTNFRSLSSLLDEIGLHVLRGSSS